MSGAVYPLPLICLHDLNKDYVISTFLPNVQTFFLFSFIYLFIYFSFFFLPFFLSNSDLFNLLIVGIDGYCSI